MFYSVVFTMSSSSFLAPNNSFFQVGVGMSMEGIEQNPIVYDLMSEMAFQNERVDVKVKLKFSSILRCLFKFE